MEKASVPSPGPGLFSYTAARHPITGMQAASCAISFSSLVRRKAAKEGTLRRGRFRFLPLLRTSLIETAKGACGPPLDSPGSGGKTVRVCYRLHHAAPSEASLRGNRGDSLFHDCTRFWKKPGHPRGPTQSLPAGNPRESALFFLTPGAALSFFSARRKER